MSDEEEYALLQCMECKNPLNEFDEGLGLMCLGWSVDDEMDQKPVNERVGRR